MMFGDAKRIKTLEAVIDEYQKRVIDQDTTIKSLRSSNRTKDEIISKHLRELQNLNKAVSRKNATIKALREKIGKKVTNRQESKKPERDGWTIHTQYHWSRDFNDYQLDYWPTTHTFRYKNQTHKGDVYKFMEENGGD